MNLKCFITAPSSGTQPPITPSSRDPCSPNPCSNGGTCNNNSNPYTCSCMFGYSGDICDINSYEGKNFGVNMHSKKIADNIQYIYLSHKLRCYTRISGPEKSRNNTWKNIVFFHVCWYGQSTAFTSLAFGATRSGWWINGKAFTILNTSCFSELSRIMAAKTLKNSVSLTDKEVQTFPEGKENRYTKRKTESCVFIL